MSDPFDQLPMLLAETPGLDEAAFERLAAGLKAQMAAVNVEMAATPRSRGKARSLGPRRSLPRRAAAVAFVAMVVAGGIVLANSSSGPSSAAGDQIAYVTAVEQFNNGNSDYFLIPFDLRTSELGQPIKVPGQVVVAPGGKLAVVFNRADDLAYVLDLRTGRLGPPINVGPKPVSVAFTPNGTRAYIADAGRDACVVACLGPGAVASDAVVTLDLTTGRPGRPIHVCQGPMELAMAPSGLTLLVACYFNGVMAISTATNRVIAHYAVPGSPGNIAFIDGGTSAVVGQIFVEDLQEVAPSINIINLETGHVGKTISAGVPGGTTYVSAVTPSGIAYINGWRQVVPSQPGILPDIFSLDLRTGHVDGPIKVPGTNPYATTVGYWKGFGVRYLTAPDQTGKIYVEDPGTGRIQTFATGSPNFTGISASPSSDVIALDPKTPLAIVEAFPVSDGKGGATSFLKLADLATGKVGPTVWLPRHMSPSSVEFAGGPSLNSETPSWPVGL